MNVEGLAYMVTRLPWIPKNQHGFRLNRSTMTAWCEMQENWAQNSEVKNMTGILLWDVYYTEEEMQSVPHVHSHTREKYSKTQH